MIDKIRNLKKINCAHWKVRRLTRCLHFSVNEALRSGGYAVDTDVEISAINSENVTSKMWPKCLQMLMV